nr:MAG TPA: hypothetical protein [Caudoviricetes sp.]
MSGEEGLPSPLRYSHKAKLRLCQKQKKVSDMVGEPRALPTR